LDGRVVGGSFIVVDRVIIVFLEDPINVILVYISWSFCVKIYTSHLDETVDAKNESRNNRNNIESEDRAMKEYVFAPQSNGVEEYPRAHVVPLYPQ